MELVGPSEEITEKELMEMDFNSIINMIGYEWFKYKSNPEAAIKIFEYGIALMPNDADLFDSLGEVYFLIDDYKHAEINYKKSLAINPDNENAKEFLAKIELKK